MKVFLTGASFTPEHGGPARSVSQLGIELAKCGVEVGIWAPDGSAVSSPITKDGPCIQCFTGSIELALSSFGRPDLIHDSGLWLWHSHLLAKFAKQNNIPRIVSLRGMLEPWSLNNRRWKKRIAWSLYQKKDLLQASAIHATAEIEAENAKNLGLPRPVIVIPNGVHLPTLSQVPNTLLQPKAKQIALFVSRIHPKKGLPMLLKAWATIRPNNWELHIAGPGENGHDTEVALLIRQLNLSDSVTMLGPVYDAQKNELYQSADLFVLPTYSENFGIVIAEALSFGVPVLTTQGAPWELLATHDCGWWVDVSIEGITSGLRQAFSKDTNTLHEMGLKGCQLINEQFRWKSIARKMILAYEDVLEAHT